MTNEDIIYKAIEEVCNTDSPQSFVEHNQTVYNVAKRALEIFECCKKASRSGVSGKRKTGRKQTFDLPQTSIPRDLCKQCYNWCSQEDVGFNDIPHCIISDYNSIDYLRHVKDDCPKFVEW